MFIALHIVEHFVLYLCLKELLQFCPISKCPTRIDNPPLSCHLTLPPAKFECGIRGWSVSARRYGWVKKMNENPRTLRKGNGSHQGKRTGLRVQVVREEQRAADSAGALVRERDMLVAIMENTHAQLAFLDKDFNFVRVNSAYAQGSGHTMEELIGRNHFELFPNPENEAIFTRVRETGEQVVFHAKPFEYADQPWRGVTYWDWSLAPVKDGVGQVVGFVFSLVDVTEQVRSRNRLEETLLQLQSAHDELALSHARAEQRAAELDGIFTAMNDTVIIYDAEGRILRANPVAVTALGFDPTGMTLDFAFTQVSIQYGDGTPSRMEELSLYRALRGEKVSNQFLRLTSASGQTYAIIASAAPLVVEGVVSGAVATWCDISNSDRLATELADERSRLQKVLIDRERANRALLALTRCNREMTCATEEVSFLHKVCEIIVEVCGYRLAWVGLADQDEHKTVRPVAQYGNKDGYLDISWADNELGRGPTGTAIRSGRPSICRNTQTDPRYLVPWCMEAAKRGYASSVALPLTADDRTFGALNVYAAEPDAFNAEKIELLEELAQELAFGIAAIRAHQDRRQVWEALRRGRGTIAACSVGGRDGNLALGFTDEPGYLGCNPQPDLRPGTGTVRAYRGGFLSPGTPRRPGLRFGDTAAGAPESWGI